MRVLVTGLGGFVGSSLGPAIEGRGHEVRGAGREVRVLAEASRGCDAVVHLANIAHAGASPAPGARRSSSRRARRQTKRCRPCW